ncbi:tRNA cyclic N6-threonylcarbamoyladenosine(37) synthase TcdA [Herbaspirillum sp. RTI4]|uniref:tRNA cyclic N6-threonylcarbamoyladenosine(37) synthase TcdA n=1 Tax=Herbaspirillum sp. RTI4 TaxID=3048640 RepID=UPI002AB41B3C|nr:tRNA cyclic N6-threonylcarbamoyladenosine(37) synthase TcdA [Herbaspirillum sp. RTI4]MDY7579862.1 tRNA cyclic N6-threonylcarbamoyladenosine(37) synthase TcdA [Herbaspirillum sp. RTI4]MEA9981949.1 tRNA cyclic N6-threonylcarbamoyladenosine(37) synthase TcdA [Herbaspirillum sp. RTI4]
MNLPTSPTLVVPAADDIDFDRRFGGIARLYGAAGLERLRHAHVCVVGVGGVGSWVVEALARSAVGAITMIDLDNLAESNINRQIHALTDTLGQAKVSALHARIRQINPRCQVTEIEDFLTAENIPSMVPPGRFDFVIDAIDDVRAKVALIAYCRTNKVPLITIGSAGGQIDPTRIELRDLSRTEQEPLLAKVRKRLRSEHGFSRGSKNNFGIAAVFSSEPLRFPETEVCAVDGVAAVPDAVTGLNCAGFGSAMVVTASFGLIAAAHVLAKIAAGAAVLPELPATAADEA